MNTIGFARREVARTPDGELHVVEAPPYGFGTVIEPQGAVSIDDLVLENEHVRAKLAPDGTVVSLLERSSGRETLAAPGNRLELYDDRPVDCDAWDIDPLHLETRPDPEADMGHTSSPTRCFPTRAAGAKPVSWPKRSIRRPAHSCGTIAVARNQYVAQCDPNRSPSSALRYGERMGLVAPLGRLQEAAVGVFGVTDHVGQRAYTAVHASQTSRPSA